MAVRHEGGPIMGDRATLENYRNEVLSAAAAVDAERGGDVSTRGHRIAATSAHGAKRCVVCGLSSAVVMGAGSPRNARESALGAVAQSLGTSHAALRLQRRLQDTPWVEYDRCNHCFDCARRLMLEVLCPHFTATRRDTNEQVLAAVEAQAEAQAREGRSGRRRSSSGAVFDPTDRWTCVTCGQPNAGRDTCYSCHNRRVDAPLPCPHCNADVHKIEFCGDVETVGTDALMTTATYGTMRRHDPWTCLCGHENIGMLAPHQCVRCGGPRPWFCATCRQMNGGHMEVCDRCGGNTGFRSLGDAEEQELCALTGASVESARRERRALETLAQAQHRLRARLRALQLVEVPAPDDGNCLFSSVSFQLTRTMRLHEVLRRMACEHILLNRSHFEPFVFATTGDGGDANEIFARYVDTMLQDRTWGDALVLHAVARAFRVDIHVVSAASSQWHTTIHAPRSGAARNPPIFIAFVAELHYNSVVGNADDAAEVALDYRRWLQGDRESERGSARMRRLTPANRAAIMSVSVHSDSDDAANGYRRGVSVATTGNTSLAPSPAPDNLSARHAGLVARQEPGTDSASARHLLAPARPRLPPGSVGPSPIYRPLLEETYWFCALTSGGDPAYFLQFTGQTEVCMPPTMPNDGPLPAPAMSTSGRVLMIQQQPHQLDRRFGQLLLCCILEDTVYRRPLCGFSVSQLVDGRLTAANRKIVSLSPNTTGAGQFVFYDSGIVTLDGQPIRLHGDRLYAEPGTTGGMFALLKPADVHFCYFCKRCAGRQHVCNVV